eukprot:CAMPEP_0172719096 /NCGR_PEP_ID=MMETSP1074-20121228/75307_1 /TAXON_ID=2916 /ORGANISM="Ceratium fusus, Strain PA161109" /LENGTH=177 /DNA_ID=CAMNT_0013544415 /DNA_START=59 /DNA_END=592 /DNA_ORIENTATION=-
MAATQSPVLKPTVLWAQRQDSVYVTVDIKDAVDISVHLDETALEFAGRSGGDDKSLYEFKLELFAPIRRQESKWSAKRCPEFFLRKETAGTWSRLQKSGKFQWIKVDWAKWADSDEEDEKGGFDTDDMTGVDFSSTTQQEAEGSDDRDSILADLDEDIAVETEDEASELPDPQPVRT